MAIGRGSIKGVVLKSRLGFVREHKGESGLRNVLADLPGADRALLDSLLPSSWYAFELNERLDQAIAREMGVGDEIFTVLGERSATDNLGASHRAFVVDQDPHGLLQHAASIHQAYYDTGYRTYERTGERSAVLRTHDCASFSRPECLTNIGWHRKAIEICGGRNPRVTDPQCRARGDAVCTYACDWE
jgi:uncharacterized protein (TIGR02265 family)